MTKVSIILVGVACLVALSKAHAEIGTTDNVPAATLLLPYFEVDLDSPNGITTILSVTNTGSAGIFGEAALAHVTLWTDLGIPTINFDIYLTGFDVVSINVRDIFNGNLPITAPVGQDPTDTTSPKGIISDDVSFDTCNGILPFVNPALSQALVASLRAAHTGKASVVFGGGMCVAVDHGDNVARGYVTIDSVSECSVEYPSAAGYFVNGGTGVANNRNTLSGDFLFFDPTNNFAAGESLVSIEAADSLTGQGTYTFYGRLLNGSAADNREPLREPLATSWAAEYLVGGSNNATTNLVVWRDPVAPAVISPFTCGAALPAPFPLSQKELVAFDTEENYTLLSGMRFPYATNRVQLTMPDLPHRAGWLGMDLNESGAIADSPFTATSARQAYVMVLKESLGEFSGLHSAIQLQLPTVPPTPPPTETPTPTPTETPTPTPTETPST